MTRLSLVRAGGLAAIAGGVLRAAAAFAPVVVGSDLQRESLYLVVDVCLALGLLAFYALNAERLGRRGAAGLALALLGIAAVRASRIISAVDLYPAAALATACGVILLAVSAWTANRLPTWVPVTLLLSTLVGIIGSVVGDASTLFVCSGVMFGVAFAALGFKTWRSRSPGM